jgi:hypothetical protein
VKGDRGAADFLDLPKDILAILLADDVAQHRAKHADDRMLFFCIGVHVACPRWIARDAYRCAPSRDT